MPRKQLWEGKSGGDGLWDSQERCAQGREEVLAGDLLQHWGKTKGLGLGEQRKKEENVCG